MPPRHSDFGVRLRVLLIQVGHPAEKGEADDALVKSDTFVLLSTLP